MKKFLTKSIAMMMIGSVVLAGCAKPADKTTTNNTGNTTSSQTEKPADKPKDKTKIKFYGKVIEYTSGPKMTDALIEQFKDTYEIEAIQVDWGNMEKVIRTGIASGDPCDIYNYPPTGMINFEEMAVDLTPYLDADPEWKAQFDPAALAAGTVNGKILSIPWESNFSVVLANKQILEDLGIEIPEAWDLEKFTEVAKTIQDAGIFPFANATDLNRGDWMYRNAMLSEVVSNGTYEAYTKNEVAFNGSEAKAALEGVKSLYDNNFMYPGEGAVTVKNDEIKAASEMGFEVVPVPWPSVGKDGAILGGYNGFFIPQNSKNIDAAVEVLKAFTSPEIQGIHAAEGYLPANNQVEVTDPFVTEILKQAATLRAPEDPASATMQDYRANKLMADLMLNGGVDSVLETLEKFRQEALAQ